MASGTMSSGPPPRMKKSITKQIASDTLLFTAHWFGARRFEGKADPSLTRTLSSRTRGDLQAASQTNTNETNRIMPSWLREEVMANFVKSRTMGRSGTKSLGALSLVRGLTKSMTASMTAKPRTTDSSGGVSPARAQFQGAFPGGPGGFGGPAPDLQRESRSWNAPIHEDTMVQPTITEEEEEEGQQDEEKDDDSIARDSSQVLPVSLGKSTKSSRSEIRSMLMAAEVSGSLAVETLQWQYRPIFTFVQTIVAVAAWAILPFFKSAAYDQDALGGEGLESIFPGWTAFLLQRDCEDLRFQVWRWLSYQFSHASFVHIFGNSVMLIIVAVPLEGFHGHIRLALLLNVGVVFGAAFDAILQNSAQLVGMSAGVYALMGMHYADVIMNWGQTEFRYGKTALLLFLILIDSTSSMLNELGGQGSNVSHGSHLGGWLSGVLMGVLLGRNLKVHDFEILIQAVAGTVLIGLMIFAAVWLTDFPPRSVFQAESWCWARQVYNNTLFKSNKWECVFCSSSDCVRSWSAQRYIETVAIEACFAG